MVLRQNTPVRRRRAIPSQVPVIELQARDLDVIECILRLGGHLSADLLALQFWGTRESDPARRRLRKLLDAKLLSATLVGSRLPNIYFVTRRGLDALAAERPNLEQLRLPEPVRTVAGLRHAELVSAARLYLSALADARHGQLLCWSGGRSQVANDLGLPAAHIAPDGIAELRMGSSEGIALVEADVGTETSALRAKLDRYGRYLVDRKGMQLWIVAAGGPARQATVEQWCKEANVGRHTRLFAEADVLVRPAKAPVARLFKLWAASDPERAGGG